MHTSAGLNKMLDTEVEEKRYLGKSRDPVNIFLSLPQFLEGSFLLDGTGNGHKRGGHSGRDWASSFRAALSPQ